MILGAATVRDAEPGQITLVDQLEKAHLLEQCAAAAVVAPRGFVSGSLPTIQVDDVHSAFAAIVSHFNPRPQTTRVGILRKPMGNSGSSIHRSATPSQT